MAEEKLELRYVSLDTLELWDRNPKVHDLDKLAESIRRYGFKDPPRFEPELNSGEGGIVAGNGRMLVLRAMKEDGEEPPRGIGVDDQGGWAVPVLFGVDARSQGEAERFGVDHNSLVLAGGGLAFEDLVQLFDEEALKALLSDTPETADLLVGIESVDLDALLTGPGFEAVAAGDQPRLDQKKQVTCPECGHEFRP